MNTKKIIRVQNYEADIAKLRATNKKLRAEVASAQRERDVFKGTSAEHYERIIGLSQDMHEAMRVGETWQEAFRILATRGKAK